MSYGSKEFLQALLDVREGRLSPEQHADMELYILRCVQDKGVSGVEELLHALDPTELGDIEISTTDNEISARISKDGVDSLLIKASADDMMAYALVNLHSTTPSSTVVDPRHAWFYTTWERVQGDNAHQLADRSDAERAVFHIALLEAQVMNGGLGQYLVNTDGAHVADTLACLEVIGAAGTRKLLKAADDIGRRAESYDAAWDDWSGDFGKLDDAFMKSGEDLAALTADAFQD